MIELRKYQDEIRHTEYATESEVVKCEQHKDGVPSCIFEQKPFETIEVPYNSGDNEIRIVRETYLISEMEGYLLRRTVYDENNLVLECVNTQISVNEAEMITRIHGHYRNIFRYLKHDVETLQQVMDERSKINGKNT